MEANEEANQLAKGPNLSIITYDVIDVYSFTLFLSLYYCVVL